jgi:hypothetical protein
VRRFIFNAKTLKLCARSSSHPSPTNRAVSIRCRMFSVMSELGQKRKSWPRCGTSALPPIADMSDIIAPAPAYGAPNEDLCVMG